MATSLGPLRRGSAAAETSQAYLCEVGGECLVLVLLECQMLAWSSVNTEMRGPILSLAPAPFSPSACNGALRSGLRQVAQFIFLYLKQDFGSQGREASLRSAGWAPSRCHGITLLSMALLHWVSFSVAFCRSCGADGSSAQAAKTPPAPSAGAGGSGGHPSVGALMPAGRETRHFAIP